MQLLKMDGLSIKEAARRMQMTEAALKVAAHRAYERISEEPSSMAAHNENGN